MHVQVPIPWLSRGQLIRAVLKELSPKVITQVAANLAWHNADQLPSLNVSDRPKESDVAGATSDVSVLTNR